MTGRASETIKETCPMPANIFQRYAIYYTPPPGPLERFGAEWLGWDIAAGRIPSQRANVPNLPIPINDLTQAPRRYGFHATIKPPFRLAPDRSEAELNAALTAFCAAHPRAHVPELALTQFGRILALVPADDAATFSPLASQAVQDFDAFRASLSEAEIARHNSQSLSASQINLLHRWGYPHVMERFRWHMTLTGKLKRAELAQARAALSLAVTPLLLRPFTMDALSLVGEDSSGHFHLIQRVPLSG